MIFLVLPDFADEDQLLAQAVAGSQAAVMQIYESYYSPIYQYIRMRVADSATAEDLASDVFMRLLKALKGENAPRQSLRGWLFRVARFVIHDHYGEAQRLVATTLDEWIPDSEEQQPETELLRKLDSEMLRRAIGMLKSDYQEVLILRFGQLLSLQETADIMGKNVGAIKVQQLRALEHLRKAITHMNSGTGLL